MEKLNLDELTIAYNLLSQIENQTVLHTIMAGETPGVIYVENKNNPRIAFAQFKQRAFLSGEPSVRYEKMLKNFFTTKVRKHCEEFNVPFFRLAVNHPEWLNIIVDVLYLREPIITGYRCYQKTITGKIDKFTMPEGFGIVPVDKELLNNSFSGREDLLEEMCSERESVEAFLEKSFGVAAFKDNALAGWCLSEYNHQDQCEVGIATLPPYRRIGLAKAMTCEFINQAFENGITRILWHCFESNLPSWRTALSAGFSLGNNHEVLMLYWVPSLNQAVHGNFNFEQENYSEALIRYQKALALENPEPWMAFNAACSAVHLDRPNLAFKHLSLAVDLGFNNLVYLVTSRHLDSLKKNPKWDEIIIRLNQNLQSES